MQFFLFALSHTTRVGFALGRLFSGKRAGFLALSAPHRTAECSAQIVLKARSCFPPGKLLAGYAHNMSSSCCLVTSSQSRSRRTAALVLPCAHSIGAHSPQAAWLDILLMLT